MSKRDLAGKLRQQYGLSWREAGGIVETILGSIKKELRAGGTVILHGFGTFSVKKYGPKKYRDIKTRKIRTRGATTRVKFKAARGVLGH